MAITKLLRLKESPRGSPAAHLKHNLLYICNPDKCAGGTLIGGNAGITPEIIWQTMLENKRLWGKEDGTQGFHYVISFPPELNVSEETACAIAEDFVSELLGDRFYYAYAVHNDQHHMHVHITFDSVSKEDGYKFHSPKGDWEKRIQPITDRVCKKFGLPVLYFTEEKKGKSYDQWKRDRQPEPDKENIREDASWYDLIRDDIDEAISRSASYEEFLSALQDRGYDFHSGKYLSVRPHGKERPVRTSRLGKGYTIDEIKDRIKNQKKVKDDRSFVRYGDVKLIMAAFYNRHQENKGWRMTPFQKRYYERWRNSFLRNRSGRDRPYLSNTDVVRIRRLSNAVKFMIDESLTDFESLEEKWEELQKEKEALRLKRSALQRTLYNKAPLKDLARYEKLMREKDKDPSSEKTKEMAFLFSRIEKTMSIEKARGCRDEVRGQIRSVNEKIKEYAEQEKLLEDLYMFYFEMPVPDRKERTASLDDEARNKKEAQNARWKKERTRITVHKSMIRSADEENGYLIKIPGRDSLVRLPREDCFLYKSEEVLSVFLYHDEDYVVYDAGSEEERTEKGGVLRVSFDTKKDRKKQKEKGR